MTQAFDKDVAERHLKLLLKRYRIKVVRWSAGSCGRAYISKREVKIPKPTNPDRFAVAMHEIKHIIDGRWGTSFQMEFACDKYALEQLNEIGCGGQEEWIKRSKWHTLANIAMAHNRGLRHENIPAEIREFVKDVDLSTWIGYKVFVSWSSKNDKGYIINLTQNISKDYIVMLLGRKGLMLDKSEADDSTYGMWRVRGNGDSCEETFYNLSEIINHYKLSL